jgi:hypothetical protein
VLSRWGLRETSAIESSAMLSKWVDRMRRTLEQGEMRVCHA